VSRADQQVSRAGQYAKSPSMPKTGLLLLAALLLAALAIAPAGAAAATPEPFWTRCAADTETDVQCNPPRGIATSPVDGHVFVADQENARIVEFTAWGQLVRTWGWGVVASGSDDNPQNEIQEVTVDATGGSFILRFRNGFDVRESAPISFDASASAVQAALLAIGPPVGEAPGFSPGDIAVSGPDGGPWTIEFTGTKADTDVRQLQVTSSLTGGSATATVTTAQSGANFEVCTPADGDTCREGQAGSAAGQFGQFSPQGVAVDSAGDVYVVDRPNQRVQKFSPSGQFLRMWGKGVNSGTAVNKEICTNVGAPTDVCGAGGEGTGPGQFGAWKIIGSYIAIDTLGTASAADDKVYVGDAGRIQRFSSSGEYQADLSNPEGLLSGKKVSALAVVPSGNLFLAREGTANVLKLNATTGAKECEATVAAPEAIAADAAGSAYAVSGSAGRPVRKFNSSCAEVIEEETVFPFFPTFPFTPGFSQSIGIATGSACLSSSDYDLYVANSAVAPNGFVRAYGPVPDDAHILLCPPPPHAPAIEEQWADSVETDRAAVQAEINPEFWIDTSYYVQYATAACIDGEAAGWAAACVKETPTPPGALLGAGATGVGAGTAKVPLTGLVPATEYRYRFVAQSRFDHNGTEVNPKGGPVFGKGGTEGSDGVAGVLTTPAVPGPPPLDSCPNAPFRGGASARLPDCRAYEMVSPADKHGGDITNGARGEHYNQAAPDGNRITYSAAPAFGDQPSSKLNNQYLASRYEERAGEGGWSNRGINAPLGRQIGDALLIAREVGTFAPDLCSEWLVDYNNTPLTPEGQTGYANLYRQDLCGGGGFEALTTTVPVAGAVPAGYVSKDSIQGFSADRSKVFFTAAAGLLDPPEAAPSDKDKTQIYEHSGEGLHLVSVLPGGVADPGGAAVGGGVSGDSGGNLMHAVSEDGSRVFWVSPIAYSPGQPPTQLYLREHPEQGIVADECSEPSKACTVAVSSGSSVTFWSATPDGSTALYSEGVLDSAEGGMGNATLYRFDVETETRTPIATGVRGVLGASEDLARVYFVSTEVLTGGEENELGDKAQPSEPNLYLDEEGEPTFVATLLGGKNGDSAGQRGDNLTYSIASFNPHYNAARTTADGSHIAFQSRARLTHFDNTDRNSGEADVEVFIYEAGGTLHCVSCNPTGARPSGHELAESYGSVRLGPTGVWGAAWIPASEHPLYSSNVLSEDGGRLFFMSYDAWAPGDTNGAQDVYEWEAPGEGHAQARCSKDSPAYHEQNGGCVYLISTGESPFESEFWDASPDGRDVFFSTESSLLPQDPGNVDLYDAREGGGFAQPSTPAVCEGEACQTPPAAPNDPTPASSAFEGAGNLVEKPASCRKGKVRRRGRCVARKHHKRAQRHHTRHATNRGRAPAR
jgi:NHL repeat